MNAAAVNVALLYIFLLPALMITVFGLVTGMLIESGHSFSGALASICSF